MIQLSLVMKHRAAKPHRGEIGVASHSYGWYVDAAWKACRRYAICITYYRVPTARPLPSPFIQPYEWLATPIRCLRHYYAELPKFEFMLIAKPMRMSFSLTRMTMNDHELFKNIINEKFVVIHGHSCE